jgi:protein TonB
MNNNTYLDLVFEGRNKEYGAYELRLNYGQRVKKSLLIMLSFVTLLGVIIYYVQLGQVQIDQISYRNTPTVLTDIVMEKTVPIELPTSVASTTPIDAINLPPEIVENTVVKVIQPLDTSDNKAVIDPNAVLTTGPAIQGNGGTEVTSIQPNINSNSGGTSTAVTPIVTPIIETKEIENAQTVDAEPEFPGGMNALVQFIQNELTYPAAALEANFTCQVVVDFVVDEKGKISMVTIQKPQKYGCDTEASRVVKKMPKWKPALMNGQPVKCYFSVPINFILEDSD